MISGVQPDSALRRIAPSSRMNRTTNDASHSSRADSAKVASTVCRSNAERLITLRTLGGRGLLGERLLEIARLGLHLVEQPHVLDRDDRLVGEGLHDLDLAFGETTRFEAPEHEDSFHPSFTEQR